MVIGGRNAAGGFNVLYRNCAWALVNFPSGGGDDGSDDGFGITFQLFLPLIGFTMKAWVWVWDII